MKYVLLFFLVIFLNAKTLIATYEAKYGIFGTIAEAKGIFEKNETNYKIETILKTEGIASKLSNGMMQKHTSKGIIKNNLLIPLQYTTYIKRNSKKYLISYNFLHKKREIIKEKYLNNKLIKKEKFRYYAPYDILSLYFNLPFLIKKRKLHTFYAVGGRKTDGRIDINFCNKDLFEEKGICIKANLYNKIFAGDKGILYLLIEPSNWITIKGILKNVLKIGDLKGELIDFKQVP